VSLFSDIRDDYILRLRPKAEVEARHYAQGNLAARIRRAATAQNSSDLKHKHQWRIPPLVLARFAVLLENRSRDIKKAASFAELLAILESERIEGVAELTIYDTALRIGRGQALEPKAVYLHAGTRKGAKKLGLNVRRPSIPRNEFHADFAGLTCAELEDVLCTYARYLGPDGEPFQRPGPCNPAPKVCPPGQKPPKPCR
jgi:hypothetical protein